MMSQGMLTKIDLKLLVSGLHGVATSNFEESLSKMTRVSTLTKKVSSKCGLSIVSLVKS